MTILSEAGHDGSLLTREYTNNCFSIYFTLRYIFLIQHVKKICRALPPSYSMGSGGSFLGLRRPWREADHSPPSSAKVKNSWNYNSTPPAYIHGVHINFLTFTLGTGSY